MNNLFRMRELIELINNADKAYFGEDKPIMTDKEYDALVEELTKIEKETGIHFKNSPIGKVGGEIKKVLNPSPTQSLCFLATRPRMFVKWWIL